MRYVMVVALLSLTAASGCATAYTLNHPMSMAESGLATDPAQVSALEKGMTDQDIARLLDADVRAKVPTTLAVAAIDGWSSLYRSPGRYDTRCDLRPIGAGELKAWEDATRGLPQILGVHAISALTTEGERPTLHSLRTAAARTGSELVLVYYVSESSVDNYNDASALYWTLVGLWTVPGNTYEHWTICQAVILDCRTGMILGTASGDSRQKAVCPVAYASAQRAKLAEAARTKAMEDLVASCKPLVRDVVAKAAAKGKP
jgi:hypothetical protein